jgi:hypothetical protein
VGNLLIIKACYWPTVTFWTVVIENREWGSNIDIIYEQGYLIDWIENRVVFLDNYFEQL